MGKLEELKINDIVTALEGLKYGSVLITVHNGEITQVEKTEKKRYPNTNANTLELKN